MRIFVLGNGATLVRAPFHLLKDEITIACNSIHKAYRFTDWRPTYYVKVDFTPGEDWRAQVEPHLDGKEKCLLWDAFRSGAEKSNGNSEYITSGVGNHSNVEWISDCKCSMNGKAGWHFPTICSGMNSIIPMVQLAVREGATEIYLLGCDGNFDESSDHFVPDYYDVPRGRDYKERNTYTVRKAHEFLAATCPVPVYNCSKESEYKMWKYVDIQEVLDAKE